MRCGRESLTPPPPWLNAANYKLCESCASFVDAAIHGRPVYSVGHEQDYEPHHYDGIPFIVGLARGIELALESGVPIAERLEEVRSLLRMIHQKWPTK